MFQKNTNLPELDVNSLAVAKPCSAGWEQMSGDERRRHCADCGLNVYNISAMSANDARDLIASHEGKRLCIRLHKRADGTVITSDCPRGLAAYRRRVGRIATAAFASVFGLFTAGYSQQGDQAAVPETPPSAAVSVATLEGVVVDRHGAVIPGAKISVVPAKGETLSILSDENGYYILSGAQLAGEVRVTVEKNGFKTVEFLIVLEEGRMVNRRIKLKETSEMVEMGIYAPTGPVIDPASSDVTTTFQIRDGSGPIPN